MLESNRHFSDKYIFALLIKLGRNWCYIGLHFFYIDLQASCGLKTFSYFRTATCALMYSEVNHLEHHHSVNVCI